jgi:hypothetical protein
VVAEVEPKIQISQHLPMMQVHEEELMDLEELMNPE